MTEGEGEKGKKTCFVFEGGIKKGRGKNKDGRVGGVWGRNSSARKQLAISFFTFIFYFYNYFNSIILYFCSNKCDRLLRASRSCPTLYIPFGHPPYFPFATFSNSI